MALNLKSVKNARDLGGLSTVDGRKVKENKIFRTANLSMLSKEDEKILKEKNLTLVLDLRTSEVINANPNVKIDGVEIVHIPIMKELGLKVTPKSEFEKRSIGEILLGFSKDFDGKGEEWMRNFYSEISTSDYSLSKYKIFLDYIKNNTQGATLFHCTAGKDRTGVGAILLLTLLGVKREQIICDYLKTNESTKADIESAEKLGRERGESEAVLSDIAKINGVLEDYARGVLDFIDTFPTPEDFFKQKMHLTDSDINTIRLRLLE